MSMHQETLKALVLTFVHGSVQQWANQVYAGITPPDLNEYVTRVFNTCWEHLTHNRPLGSASDLEYEIAVKVKAVFAPHCEGYVADSKDYDISITTLRKAVNERYGPDYGFSEPHRVDHERVRIGIYNTAINVAFGADFYFKTGKFA